VAVVLLLGACDGEADHALTRVERPRAPVVADGGADAVLADVSSPDTEPGDTAPADSAPSDSGAPDTVGDSGALDGSTTETAVDTTPSDTAVETSVGDTSVPADVTNGHTCHIGAVEGVCRNAWECGEGEAAIEGVCAGSPQVRCCLPSLDRCSVAGVTGACLDVADCPAPDWQSTAGRCPGAAAIRCCTAVGAENGCDPEARPTPNAGLVVEEPGDAGCAPGMALVAGFCIDRYEGSLVLVDDPATTFSPFVHPDVPVRALSVAWAVPQGHISGTEARAACQAAGKRLCTSAEWLRACQGAATNTYPYGPTREPGVCNDDRREHVAYEYFQTTESWVFSELDHPCLDQLPNSIDLNGENEGCVTEDGVFDMMGNRHEWVDDAEGTFRGGFLDDTVINGNGCLYRTTAHDIGHWDYSTGFRCCADAN